MRPGLAARGMINAVAKGSDELKEASRKFNLGVQIVSPPPDQMSPIELTRTVAVKKNFSLQPVGRDLPLYAC